MHAFKLTTMILRYCIGLFLFLSLTSCTYSQPNKNGKGGCFVELITTFIEPGATGPADPGLVAVSKIWYRDSFAIEEVFTLKTVISPKKEIKNEQVINYYRFCDIRNKKMYLFKHLADTAVCYKKYNFGDKGSIDGGWGFSSKKRFPYTGRPKLLGDTIIDNIVYKQMRLVFEEKNNKLYRLCLYRCDKPLQPFNFDPVLSNEIGCPLTFDFFMDSTYTKSHSHSEIRFTADSLTPSENTIFDAWIKKIAVKRK
jgi:hypothetical protein